MSDKMELDAKQSSNEASTSAGDTSISCKPSKSAIRRRKKKDRVKKTIMELQRFEFAELNIQHKGNSTKTLELVRRAIQMGYDSVVINIDVGDINPPLEIKTENGDEPPTKKKKKAAKKAFNEQQSNAFPDPFLVDEKQLDLSQIQANGKKFRQFSRLTVTLNDTTSVHKLQHHPKRTLFDIVAIRCPDENMLSTMTKKGDFFDIITMDAKQLQGNKIPWLHKQKLIQACISEGISFEICYGEALQDNDTRRQFFVNGRALALISNKGKGIVLSSGAETLGQIRGPYDVANLCTLFGMDSRKGNRLVSDNCCKLLLRAHSRQTIKGALHITDVKDAPAPPHIKHEDHLKSLAAIPEFREQMEKPKPKIEFSETT